MALNSCTPVDGSGLMSFFVFIYLLPLCRKVVSLDGRTSGLQDDSKILLSAFPSMSGKNALYFLVSASNEQYQHTKDELETMMLKVGFQISSMSGFGEFVVGLK